MAKNPYKIRPAGGLKAATSALMSRLGGTPAAAELLGLSQSQAQRYGDPAEVDQYIPINRAMALQRAAGAAPITECMAAEMGGVVIWLDAVGDDDVGQDMAQLGASASALFEAYARALTSPASPNKIDAREAAEMLAILDRLMRVLADMRVDLVHIARPSEEPRK